MGKTYIDTVKYLVFASVEIGGLVEKPDVVGAVFGQTEGLLGDELDLRELQKNGRIGRIEVDLQGRGGKSIGKITLPSSLDMVETSILAAALETVDRVGPCDARIKVEKIEDTRNVKRKSVVDRAKELLKHMLTTEIPESKELSELVRTEVKVAEIQEYGPEKLPCGPGIESVEAIIISEGRADVINLLKNDINNVIAVGGANVPRTLAALCQKKEVTVFLDGDRGGDIILNQLSQVCEIDFVARAPPGKEVEELSRKELIKALRGRVPAEQVIDVKRASRDEGGHSKSSSSERFEHRQEAKTEPKPELRSERREPVRQEPRQQEPARTPGVLKVEVIKPIHVDKPQESAPAPEPGKIPKELMDSLNELENTLHARLYDEKYGLIKEIPVRDLIKTLADGQAPFAIVFDGIITQRLVDLTENKGTKVLIGVKVGNVFRKPDGLVISTKHV